MASGKSSVQKSDRVSNPSQSIDLQSQKNVEPIMKLEKDPSIADQPPNTSQISDV